ncbi:MAG: TonB-dependent receptor [Pseudomonadota bacterium]
MKRLAMLAGVSIFGLGSSIAIAQDVSDDADERKLSTITVTAQRVEQNIQDVPISITAISGDVLQDRSIESFEQLQFIAPGLAFNAGLNARQSSTTIRGIGTSLFNQGVEGSVAIVVDGIVIGREGAGILDFNDLERVEVLRGPQGTLFGKNASAGVISFVTKDPTDELSGNFRASYGSFNEVNLSAALSGPLTDGVRGRLSGFYNTRDGFLKNVFPGAPDNELGDRNEFGFRGKLAFDVGNTGEIIIGGDYTSRDDNSGALTTLSFSPGGPGTGLFGSGVPIIQNTLESFGVTPGPENDAIASEAAFFAEAEVFGIYANASFEFAGHDFVSLTSWRGWNSQDNNDADLVPLPFLAENSGDLEQRQFSQEFRLSSSQDQRLRYVGGAFFFYQDIDDRQVQIGTFGTDVLAPLLAPPGVPPEVIVASFANPTLPPTPPFPVALAPVGSQFGTDFRGTVEEFNIAGFGQAEFDVTDKLTIIGGLRLLYSDIDGTADIQIADGAIGISLLSPMLTPTPLEAGVDDFAVVWRVGLDYDFTDDISAFTTLTRGYKSGGLDNNSAAAETSQGAGDFITLEPEIPTQFEAGVRSIWADGRVTANLTGFYTIVDDFQSQAFIPTDGGLGIFSVANAGQVETFGFEADLTLIPVDGLTLSGALAYTDATFKDFDQAPCFTAQPIGPADCIDSNGDSAGDFQNLDGVDLGQSPDWIFNGLARYDFAEIFELSPFFQAGIQYRSSTISGNDGNLDTVIDDVVLIDFQLGASFLEDRASLTVYGRNIGQEDFPVAISVAAFDEGGFAQTPTFESESVYGIRLAYEF